MAHPSFDQTCAVCRKIAESGGELYQNELWHVRTIDPPSVVPGWVLLTARRHVASPADFDDVETASFGPTLRHLTRVLRDVTGALRVYLAAMGESSPHFHAHLVPRYEAMPKDAKGWAVFDLQRAAQAGEVEPLPVTELSRVAEAYRAALRADPPP